MSSENTSSNADTESSSELPQFVIDPKSQRQFIRGRFLGKGAYAQCYEFVDTWTNVVYAAKITPKKLFERNRVKELTYTEILIHKTLRHQHIVEFHGYFEDDMYVYVILELCTRQRFSLPRSATVSDPLLRVGGVHKLIGLDAASQCADIKYVAASIGVKGIWACAVERAVAEHGSGSRIMSLLEMQKRRRALTEAEVRYFLRQILLACDYMAEQRVVHRDLKPSNLLLTEDMQLKVADFGFATRIRSEGERKTTICGTPNYVAPEVLTGTGHSYEADIWAAGCITYFLLVGFPPFVSTSNKETYRLIKKNQFDIPLYMSSDAKALIKWMLHPKPRMRPSIEAVMYHDFMTKGVRPEYLPISCLTTEPEIDALDGASSQSEATMEDTSAQRSCVHRPSRI